MARSSHPILTCLQIGVAIHHGALPTPFRKEMERLLRDSVLKVTVSSPTLAQGLNLTATAVIVHSLYRDRNIIPASEFKNVIGRAGRAFIDVEGLVLYPIFNEHAIKHREWERLINDTSSLSMESGLLQLVVKLLARLHEPLGKVSLDELIEYVVNNASASNFPEIEGEGNADRESAHRDWIKHLSIFDTAILSLAGDQDIEAEQIAAKLDELLHSSLWKRRLLRQRDSVRSVLDRTLKARARFIWSTSSALQRKGYFLAGVGLATGQQLDAVAQETVALLVVANGAILAGDDERAIEAITALAERIFTISPFIPDPLPENWREVLSIWLSGHPLVDLGETNIPELLRFVENGLIYRLPWGMEAIRVRAQANQETFEDMTLGAFELGLAVPSIETGTLNRSAAILMQAGFSSRLAAIKAVTETAAEFTTARELAAWLRSDLILELSERDDWPTSESQSLWKSFVSQYTPPEKTIWTVKHATRFARWRNNIDVPSPGSPIKVWNVTDDTLLLAPTHEILGYLDEPIPQDWSGLLVARIGTQANSVALTYYGPEDIDWG